MADGIIRPRPQPLGRYLLIQWSRPLLRPALAAGVVLLAAAEFGHLDTLAAVAGHWQGIVQGALVFAALAPPAAFIALVLHAGRRTR